MNIIHSLIYIIVIAPRTPPATLITILLSPRPLPLYHNHDISLSFRSSILTFLVEGISPAKLRINNGECVGNKRDMVLFCCVSMCQTNATLTVKVVKHEPDERRRARVVESRIKSRTSRILIRDKSGLWSRYHTEYFFSGPRFHHGLQLVILPGDSDVMIVSFHTVPSFLLIQLVVILD